MEILINGAFIGSAVLTAHGTYAWRAPPTNGDVVVTLFHPNAFRPSDVSDSAETRQLAITFARLRVLTIVEPPGLWPMRHFNPNCSDQELAGQFENLGDNCELGLLQRTLGVEQLGLLRFSSATIGKLADAIDSGFDRIGDLSAVDGVVGAGEWAMYAPAYDMMWHTWISPETTSQQAILAQQKKTGYLAKKLIDDLAAGEKIFVVKRDRTLSEPEIMPLFLSMQRRGKSPLMWISVDPYRANTIEQRLPGLLHARIERFEVPYLPVHAPMPRTDGWLSIMRQAVSWLACETTLVS